MSSVMSYLYLIRKWIRWKQRFDNFEKALSQLMKFINKGEINDLEEQSLIRSFQYKQELAQNVMKYFLRFEGIQHIKDSRNATKVNPKYDSFQTTNMFFETLNDSQIKP